ncbi:hypothetical protein [Mesorhizobium sp. 128a]
MFDPVMSLSSKLCTGIAGSEFFNRSLGVHALGVNARGGFSLRRGDRAPTFETQYQGVLNAAAVHA